MSAVSNNGGRSSRRRMLQMVGAAAAIPAFSGLGAQRQRRLRHGGPSPTGLRGDPVGPMKVHAVQGGGGLRLHVREWGKANGPTILFIHGLSQSHLCWAKQYESTPRRRVPARCLRPPWSWHVRGAARARALHRRASSGPTTSRRSSTNSVSSGRCSSAGRTARSSSATTCAPTARIESRRSTSSGAASNSARRPSAR